jgi:hypothetical protein
VWLLKGQSPAQGIPECVINSSKANPIHCLQDLASVRTLTWFSVSVVGTFRVGDAVRLVLEAESLEVVSGDGVMITLMLNPLEPAQPVDTC